VPLLVVDEAPYGSRPAQGYSEQSPDPDGNPARRDVAHLNIVWFLSYRHSNDHEQDQGDPAYGCGNQDQQGEYQFSAPLLML
jgi:hypothetical protein